MGPGPWALGPEGVHRIPYCLNTRVSLTSCSVLPFALSADAKQRGSSESVQAPNPSASPGQGPSPKDVGLDVGGGGTAAVLAARPEAGPGIPYSSSGSAADSHTHLLASRGGVYQASPPPLGVGLLSGLGSHKRSPHGSNHNGSLSGHTSGNLSGYTSWGLGGLSKDEFVVPSARMMLLPEVELATLGFSAERVIGHGAFGTVYRGEAPDGSLWAVKRCRVVSDKTLQQFRKEVGGHCCSWSALVVTSHLRPLQLGQVSPVGLDCCYL